MDEIQILRKKLEREKKAREILEDMVETRTRELYIINKELEKEKYNSRERIKELNGLYSLGKLLDDIEDLEELLHRFLIDIVPPSMRFPEKVFSKVELYGKKYLSFGKEDICKSNSCISAPIVIRKKKRGELCVDYIEDLPLMEKFEQNLIDGYAERLSKIIEKKETEKILRESEERYRLLIETSDACISLISMDGTILILNSRAAEIWRKKPEDIIGKHLQDLGGPPEFYNECMTLINEVSNKKKPIIRERYVESIDKYFYEDIQPVLDSEGEIIGIQIMTYDITELKRIQQMLIQSEKMAAIGNLAAGVAHEINNPVGFIHSNLEILNKYNKKLTKYVSKIDKMSKTLTNDKNGDLQQVKTTLDSLLKQYKISYILTDSKAAIQESLEGTERVKKIVAALRSFTEEKSVEFKPANINKRIEQTLDMVWNELKYKLEVVKDFGDLPEIECDIHQLIKVFTNLLLNAAQAVENKGVVTIKTFQHNNNVVIQISDSGIGIPREHLGTIFDAFFTTKDPNKGTGLGLTTANKIVQDHGGTIKVQSEEGKGSTFTITLPIKASEPIKEE
ncbi:MAG: two-component system sensor histidine kinase NtrB [Candidatus Hodarchaeales archaeon]